MIACCGCMCSSTESLVRNFLNQAGYDGWFDIQIYKGREKSLVLLDKIPQYPEIDMLRNFLKDASKWAVIIGWDDVACRWTDIAHGGPKAAIDASFLVDQFGKQL